MSHLRYHSQVTVGPTRTVLYFADLAEAVAWQDHYRREHARNPDAWGSTFDSHELAHVPSASWRGQSRWQDATRILVAVAMALAVPVLIYLLARSHQP